MTLKQLYFFFLCFFFTGIQGAWSQKPVPIGYHKKSGDTGCQKTRISKDE